MKEAWAKFGDWETLARVLNVYAQETRRLLERFRGVTREKLPEYAVLIHGLKGSSRGILADTLGAKAEVLERAAKREDFAFVEANNGAFIKDAEKLLNGLDAALAAAKREKPKPKKAEPEAGLLAALLKACQDFDAEEADRVMGELDRAEYENRSDLVDWLRETLSVMGFKKITERLTLELEGGI
jgi:hypothetical protein